MGTNVPIALTSRADPPEARLAATLIAAIVAAKLGYRSIGREFFKPDTPVDLVLNAVSPPDNIEYTYQAPGNGIDALQEDCSHCGAH